MRRTPSLNRGFTLTELLVTLSIFVFMTALIVSKYGAFNQNTFLTDTAYDIALNIHTAQTYGVSVKGTDYTDPNFGGASQTFDTAYGVDMFTSPGLNKLTYLFTDSDKNGVYNPGELEIPSNLARGAYISAFCVGTGPADCKTDPHSIGSPIAHASVAFKRPNPDALISVDDTTPPGTMEQWPYLQITVTSSDGSNSRTVFVRQNGQISVGN